MTIDKLKKIEEIFNLNKTVYTLLDREIRLEFYPSDDHDSVTLIDIDDDVEDGIDFQLGLDKAIEYLKAMINE